MLCQIEIIKILFSKPRNGVTSLVVGGAQEALQVQKGYKISQRNPDLMEKMNQFTFLAFKESGFSHSLMLQNIERTY